MEVRQSTNLNDLKRKLGAIIEESQLRGCVYVAVGERAFAVERERVESTCVREWNTRSRSIVCIDLTGTYLLLCTHVYAVLLCCYKGLYGHIM